STIVEAEEALLAGLDFRANDGSTGVDHGEINVRCGSIRENNYLRPRADQVAAVARAPHAIGHHAEALGQFKVERAMECSADLGMMIKLRATNGHVGDFGAGQKATCLKVHVLSVYIIVPGEFGMNVREDV